jgi:cholesterol transport system auxiliary component
MPHAFCILRNVVLVSLTSLMVACATPSAPVNKSVYDFGDALAPAAASARTPATSPLALAEVQTAWGQSSTAMQYRLAYANGHELRPYAQARWSMPPGQLVAQRVRAVLGQQRPVVAPGDSATDHVLQLVLETFGQTFDTPQTSQATVHLRATLLKGDGLVAQRDFIAHAPAPTADAAGGVRALSLATQTVAEELAGWVAINIR